MAEPLYNHFGPAAADYDRGRPGYAPEVVDHTVEVLAIGPSTDEIRLWQPIDPPLPP